MRLTRIFTVIAASALLIGLAGCGSDSESASGTSEIPTFSSPTLGGAEFSSAELADKPTVLWFWAPWCSVCFAEAPEISAAAAELNGEAEIIGVGALGPVDDMNQFVADAELGQLRHISDEEAAVWAKFGVAGQPAFAFISPDGSVQIVPGSLNAEQIVEKARALS
jgi:thiol-disulfide isomerase/thioredoxin